MHHAKVPPPMAGRHAPWHLQEPARREGFCFSVPIDRSWFPNPPLVGAFCVEPWAPKGKGTMMGHNVQTAFCFILHATVRHACCCDPLVVASL